MPNPLPYVAVIDESIGFLNRRFRVSGAPDETRIQAIWLQALERPKLTPGHARIGIGRVLGKSDIDAILATPTAVGDEGGVYRRLNSELHAATAHRGTEYIVSHGTHILDQAAGADSDDAADAAPILAVQLPPEAVADTSGKQFESYLIQGVRWILEEVAAGDATRPGVVINISFGMMAGPKDGSHFLEEQIATELDRWENQNPGRYARVVFAFGNGYLNRQVSDATLAPNAAETFGWRIQPDDRTSSYMELYTSNDADRHGLEIALTDPKGTTTVFGPITGMTPAPPPNFKVESVAGDAAIYELSLRRPGGGPRPLLAISVAPTGGYRGGPVAPAGLWHVAITNHGTSTVDLRAEIQRDDTLARHRDSGRQSYFELDTGGAWHGRFRDWSSVAGSNVTEDGTHSAVVTHPDPRMYRVGAAIQSTEEPAFYTAAAFADPGAVQPEISGIGENGHTLGGVLAAGTFSGTVHALNGTSTASAQIARRLAEVMANAAYPGPPAANRGVEIAALDALADWAPAPGEEARLGKGVIAPPARTDGRDRIWS